VGLDEAPLRSELPTAYAKRMAQAKVAAVTSNHSGYFVLGVATVVACGRHILSKANTDAQARAHLTLLSGRRHRVYSAICISTPKGHCVDRLVQTKVSFKKLLQSEIESYLESGEWKDKVGSYAIQGRAEIFVRFLSGSYSNVVGLPLYETATLLYGLGFSV
jgi:septum formation protein